MNTDESWIRSWRPELNWNAPAGRVLDRLAAALPRNQQWRVIVFGSAPLQLAFDASFISADVDVISPDAIEKHLAAAELLKGSAEIYIDPCQIAAFNAPGDWMLRSHEEERGGVRFIFPHPLDLLVAKTHRLEEKDLRAFRLVQRATGHPTEAEMLHGLRAVVDSYKPGFDEEKNADMAGNTRRLWRELFHRDIDVRAEIIAPALEARRNAYGSGDGLKKFLSML